MNVIFRLWEYVIDTLMTYFMNNGYGIHGTPKLPMPDVETYIRFSQVFDAQRLKFFVLDVEMVVYKIFNNKQMEVFIMLNITKKTENDAMTVALEGRLDTTTAPQLEAELKEGLDGLSVLTMDMEKLEYISSAGLRVLLSAQKVMNKQGEMKVIHVSETIMEIFEVTGFSDILIIE